MKYALLAVTMFGTLALAILPANARPGPTTIVTYKAESMKGAGKAIKGYCWTGSLSTQRSDAYRCMSGNIIMDPCFSVSQSVVNCPRDIAANTGTIVDLTRPLSEGNPANRGSSPLAFRISGGNNATCVANGTGVTLVESAGPVYEYSCRGRSLQLCTVPKLSPGLPGTYFVTCGIGSAASRTVKDTRTLFVATMWQ